MMSYFKLSTDLKSSKNYIFFFNYRQTRAAAAAAVAAAAAAAAAAALASGQTTANNADGLPHKPIHRHVASGCPRLTDAGRYSPIVGRCFRKLQHKHFFGVWSFWIYIDKVKFVPLGV